MGVLDAVATTAQPALILGSGYVDSRLDHVHLDGLQAATLGVQAGL